MKRLGFGVAAAGLLMTSVVSMAQDTGGYPDMRGQWKGTAQAVVTGSGPHNRTDGTPGETRTHNQEFTLNITRQEGPKFWGELVSKDEVTKKLGVFASDKQTIYMVDESEGIISASSLRPTSSRRATKGQGRITCWLGAPF